MFDNVNGKGIIKYFDLQKKTDKIKNLIEFDTEFILSQNFIVLMNLENEKFKVLICACKNIIQIVKLEFNEDELSTNNSHFDSYKINDGNINCLFPIENFYKKNVILKEKIFDSLFFIVKIINKRNE